MHLSIVGSGLAFFSTDFGHNFVSNVGNVFGVMLRGRGPYKPEIANDIVRTHSLLIYKYLIEYKIDGDTKAPLHRCFLSISKLKAGNIVLRGQYMNYQIFGKLHCRPLLKNSSHSFHIELRNTSGEKHPLYLPVSLVLF